MSDTAPRKPPSCLPGAPTVHSKHTQRPPLTLRARVSPRAESSLDGSVTGALDTETGAREEGGQTLKTQEERDERKKPRLQPGFQLSWGALPRGCRPQPELHLIGPLWRPVLIRVTAFQALSEDFHYSRYSTLEINYKKFYKTVKVMNHEFWAGKPNTLRPSTAVLYLLRVHFAIRNFVINFHLLFKHICLLDKIGHIS